MNCSRILPVLGEGSRNLELDIFYARIVGKNVRYQCKVANLIREKCRDESGDIEEQEFIVHSTSWRYSKPDKVMLTYIAYSDDLEFDKGKYKSLSLKKLRAITNQNRKPSSQTELQNKVVSHTMRHIAFLIQTGYQEDFKSTLSPKTVKVFEKL